MLLSVFDQYYFLQSLGWGVANSWWQAALLWVVYKMITAGNKQLPALFKHHLSLSLLTLSLAWFIITTVQYYLQLINEGTSFNGWFLIPNQSLHGALCGLSVAYTVLLLFHTVRFVQRFSSLYFLRTGQLIKTPVDIRIFTEQTAIHIGIKQKVSVWLSENVDVPSVIGYVKPVILFPVAALNQLTTAQAESVILHELAHIKRNDYVVNLLQTLMELVLFFNPFSRLLGNIARKERENCCDDWVLNFEYNRHDYAKALLILEAQRSSRTASLVLAATNGEKNLLLRVKRLFIAEPVVHFNLAQQAKLVTLCTAILISMYVLIPAVDNRAPMLFSKKSNAVLTPALASIKNASINTLENKNTIHLNYPPNSTAVKNRSTAKNKIAAAHSKEKVDNEVAYSTTLINEELLQEPAIQNIALPVIDRQETPASPDLYVKVEEERSGEKEKSTYWLRLKNNNGNPEITPLLISKKQMKNSPVISKELTKSSRFKQAKSAVKKRTAS